MYIGDTMKRLTMFLLTCLLYLTAGQVGLASAQVWELDKAHSNFYFSVTHIFSKVQGHFSEYSGEIRFDPAKLADSRLYFEIQTDSISTGISKRDKHLQSPDFFDSGKYPLLVFESTRIQDAGNGLYEVSGKFTVKGEEYDLVLPLSFEGIRNHPAAKGRRVAGFNGKLTIDRLAYKIGSGKFSDLGLVGKDVDILVTIEGLNDQ